MLAQTTRMRTLFEQYVAPEVAELLLSRHTDLMELGEVTEVTVLFARITSYNVCYTKLLLELFPHRLVDCCRHLHVSPVVGGKSKRPFLAWFCSDRQIGIIERSFTCERKFQFVL